MAFIDVIIFCFARIGWKIFFFILYETGGVGGAAAALK